MAAELNDEKSIQIVYPVRSKLRNLILCNAVAAIGYVIFIFYSIINLWKSSLQSTVELFRYSNIVGAVSVLAILLALVLFVSPVSFFIYIIRYNRMLLTVSIEIKKDEAIIRLSGEQIQIENDDQVKILDHSRTIHILVEDHRPKMQYLCFSVSEWGKKGIEQIRNCFKNYQGYNNDPSQIKTIRSQLQFNKKCFPMVLNSCFWKRKITR
jgi:hypothetical protein